MTKSLKSQAEEIITAADAEAEATDQAASKSVVEASSKLDKLVDAIFKAVSDVDIEAAGNRVLKMRQEYPDAPSSELSQRLIRQKCQATAAVGAATSGAGLIPGIGTVAAVVVGTAADLGATFKLQAELVLEIAALYEHPLTEAEKQQLVFLITGLNVGMNALTRKAGQQASLKISEKLAKKSFLKALPILGVVASAGTNVLGTYVVGQRADAYFRLGPEAMGSWRDNVRVISGLDEQKISQWLADSRENAGTALSQGMSKAKEAGQSAGQAITAGTKTVGGVTQKGIRRLYGPPIRFWRNLFHKILNIIKRRKKNQT